MELKPSSTRDASGSMSCCSSGSTYLATWLITISCKSLCDCGVSFLRTSPPERRDFAALSAVGIASKGSGSGIFASRMSTCGWDFIPKSAMTRLAACRPETSASSWNVSPRDHDPQ